MNNYSTAACTASSVLDMGNILSNSAACSFRLLPLKLWCGFLAVLLVPAFGRAAAFIYEFSGVVSEVYLDPLDRAGSLSLEVGTPVSYTFVVDFDRQGIGSSQWFAGRVPQPGFFSEMLSGSFPGNDLGKATSGFGWTEAPVGPGWIAAPGPAFLNGILHQTTEYQVTVMRLAAPLFLTIIDAHTGLPLIEPPTPEWGHTYGSVAVESWQPGDRLLVRNSGFPADVSPPSEFPLYEFGFDAQVTLQRIIPVPEPVGGALIALGFASLALGRWRA